VGAGEPAPQEGRALQGYPLLLKRLRTRGCWLFFLKTRDSSVLRHAFQSDDPQDPWPCHDARPGAYRSDVAVSRCGMVRDAHKRAASGIPVLLDEPRAV
jgi:hypothetical protein